MRERSRPLRATFFPRGNDAFKRGHGMDVAAWSGNTGGRIVLHIGIDWEELRRRLPLDL